MTTDFIPMYINESTIDAHEGADSIYSSSKPICCQVAPPLFSIFNITASQTGMVSRQITLSRNTVAEPQTAKQRLQV